MQNLRVMTFNIRGSSYARDGVNVWTNRASLNIDTINTAAPDIIGFQEAHSGNLETYQERLNAYHSVLGPPSDEPDLYDYNPIFWKAARIDLLDSGGFWLRLTPERWSKDWDSACVRAATWVKLRCRAIGKIILQLNTHLDHIGEQARVEGTRLILQRLDAVGHRNLPVIATGDFNCIPWTPDYGVPVATTFTDASYQLFLRHGFTDTYLATGQRDSVHSNTFHGFEGQHYSATRFHMAWRIDWILLRDDAAELRPQSCTILRDAAPPLYPSDHYPVLAEFSISEHEKRHG